MAAKFDLEEEDDTIGELELCSICLERLGERCFYTLQIVLLSVCNFTHVFIC